MSTYNVELGDKDQSDQDRANPTTVHTTESAEGEFLERVTLDLPGRPEADVSHADGAPCEECRETRESQKPVENVATLLGDQLEIRERREGEDEEDRHEGPGGLVDLKTSAWDLQNKDWNDVRR